MLRDEIKHNTPVGHEAKKLIDNGNLVVLSGQSATVGQTEAWSALIPSTANGLTNLWMVYQGDEIVVTNAQYKGLDPDPRNFYVASGKVFSIFKPQLGDILVFTADLLKRILPFIKTVTVIIFLFL